MLVNLSSTSALVLLWEEGSIHRSILSSKYRKLLNLDAAKGLYELCNKICPFYSEVIKNRKQCVLEITFSEIRGNKSIQIIILGAGMDSLSLEIISKVKNVKIFEIDSSISPKKSIIESLDKRLFDSLSLISADLKHPKKILNLLKEAGWNPDNSSLVIIEGVSYYLNEFNLKNILKNFQSKGKSNRVILEYLVSRELISKKRSVTSEKIFNLISKEIEFPNITRYDKNKIKNMIENQNGNVTKQFDMKEMEMNRTKKNLLFKHANSGWIEICFGSI